MIPQAAQRPFLLRDPEHFKVAFEINPWMSTKDQPDPDKTRQEWSDLALNLMKAGGTVHSAPSDPDWPDMVFPTDTAIVSGGRFLTSRFSTQDRHGEARLGADWLSRNGWTEIPSTDWPEGAYLEGGDVLAFGDKLLGGYGVRTTQAAHAGLAKAFGREVVPVKLVDPRFYHLDMSVCPLDDRRAIVSPDAWDEASRKRLHDLIEEPLVVSVEEAMTFCVNSVVIGKTIVMSDCPARVGRQLEAWGFELLISPVGEFIKAGGGIRCMTLDLDLCGETTKEL
ncbi:dimethylarginine dimethylaminohydrolase family protein [Amycolatopsis sp. NPDC059657]|uniref:dimethylarginine dimethylaminohydrolase family protein n=1 Tax=Amycolatopsis sp. NPDC059657 TaxID=3346899 RepID=UPI00366B5499